MEGRRWLKARGAKAHEAAPGFAAVRVSLVGAGSRPEAQDLARAEALGEGIARRGWTLVCGGLGGVMEAACRGARRAGGTTIGILPGSDPREANPFVGVPVATGLGQARNALVVLNGDAVVAVGGGFGALSEVALARVYGKPVAAVGFAFDVPGVERLAGAEDALHWLEARAKELG